LIVQLGHVMAFDGLAYVGQLLEDIGLQVYRGKGWWGNLMGFVLPVNLARA